MILKKFQFLIFFIFITIINIINSQDLVFRTNYGEWNDPKNWNPQRIPTLNDISQVPPSLTAINSATKILSNQLHVGANNVVSNSFLYTFYGIQSQYLVIYFGAFVFVDIQNDPSQDNLYAMDIDYIVTNGDIRLNGSIFYAPNTYIQSVYGLDFIYNSYYQIDVFEGAQALIFAQGSEVSITMLYFEQQSNFTSYSSNVLFNPKGYIELHSGSRFEFHDSTFTCYGYITLMDYDSSMYFQNTKVRILDNSTSFIIRESQLIIDGCPDVVSDKKFFTSGAQNTLFGILDSNVVFTEKSQFNNASSFIVFNSVFQTHQGFYFYSNTSGLFQDSSMQIYGDFEGFDNTYFEFKNSNVTISNKLYSSDNRILGLTDHSVLLFNQSNVVLDSNLLTIGESLLVAVDSKFDIYDNGLFSGNSIVQLNDTVFDVHGLFTCQNSSTFVSFDSKITVEGSTSFYNQSMYSFNYVDFTVNGYFYDDTHSEEILNSFHHSNLTIKGVYVNNGGFYFNYSSLACNGQFLNSGEFNAIESDISLSKTLTNEANILMENSTLTITSGSLVMKGEANLTLVNSNVEILNGQVLLDTTGSVINLYNSTLINRDGSLTFNGDIIVNKDAALTNNAKIVLTSNVLLNNENGTETFKNTGELNIENPLQSIRDSNATSILVHLVNENGSIKIARETIMLNLDQNNSTLQMKLDNLTLSIQNNLNSVKDSISFTVGENRSSLINVNKEANIENSTLIIRVPSNLSNEPKNTTLITYSKLSGSGFSNVQFKSYDPVTGEEKDLDNCKHSVQVSQSSMGLLLNSGDSCSKKSASIPTGGIIGIVCGVVALAAVVGVVIHFRNKLPKSMRLKYRLKELSKTQTESATQGN
ncbi:hypothetical protein DICPUDRAFT_158435 [Dictyostelium purpureum]|uniref:Uncharacterized protein n=1 Tax=Dictyostelium purpureum TaxID=5786 RepID=F1A1L9_DICPU|nr:uncharacterized protein DICPUDRAFT_158435 [Dictyostelium purpureum]EGC29902.1 hypothetical protein DICPUDRAFT_158435 [Dictyostelium purpureum]|eukprot:XP_003293563.1 hypothetical protein DICPUDRAFT_158435 [Dictyostelium purpureum]